MQINNTAQFLGHIGSPAVYHAPKSDSPEDAKRAVLRFSVAVDQFLGRKDENGEYIKSEPMWVQCRIFGRRATALQNSNMLKPGNQLLIHGSSRITPVEVVNTKGETIKVSDYQCVVDSFHVTRYKANSNADAPASEVETAPEEIAL